jgi:hypothetical protein
MTLRFSRSTQTIIFTLFFFLTSIPTGNVNAQSSYVYISNLPPLSTFVDEVWNGQAAELRGIYISDVLAAPIVQQPTGRNDFVSPWENTVTQFSLASRFGSTGLLAHNYLAGEGFADLEKGQKFYLIYGDGQISAFVVSEILAYQSLEPDNILSDFVDLENDNLLTAKEIFSKMYNRRGQVILQTCISSDDNPSWGRLFIIAKPHFPGAQY